ncbi:cation:proton antiporter domain-containing protein [Nitratidesulfovibrio sp. D1]|uniref:cation:proton antiporter domain-containing protein n=1 Tax=Nitratidesulfovibrio sp. D1 TaxID=3440151 RepID=UPI003EBE9946
MELPLLKEFVVIFGLSVAVIYLCHYVKVPAIVGFLLTGVVAGPHGLGLVKAAHEVEIMAEVGVVLLLFTIGLELSLGELMRLRKPVFLGGLAQVALTILAFAGGAELLGLPHGTAAFIGFLAALSSTAIVLKLLQERAQMDSPHGRISLSILIFQDLVIVPMMLLVPFLAGKGGETGPSLLFTMAKGAGIILLVFLLSRKMVPALLYRIVRTRNREVFLVSTLGFCLAIALLTSSMGLSLSLGAFLAGLIMAESEYSHSALEGIMPFRDVFTSMFFISVGMLLDFNFVLDHLPLVIGVTLSVLAVKCLLGGGATLMLGYPLRPALMVGLALCQVGEFSFVLAKAGVRFELFDRDQYQLFLAASIMTMALTPFLIAGAPRMADAAVRLLPAGARLARRMEDAAAEEAGGAHCAVDLTNHLIIVGFGIGGRHLARAAKAAGIDYTVLEMNPDTVRTFAAKGEPIAYGDASHIAVLQSAGARAARVLAIVISDPAAVRSITDTARKLNPSLHIVVRTRFISEIAALRDLGANDVIPEEFETSVEIFTRVMSRYLVPRAEIERFVEEVRTESYDMLRQVDIRTEPLAALSTYFTDFDLSAMTVDAGCMLDGMTLQQADLRRLHGLTLVAVKRGEDVLPNPDGTLRLIAGDVAYVFGPHADIAAKAGLFAARRRAWDTGNDANGSGLEATLADGSAPATNPMEGAADSGADGGAAASGGDAVAAAGEATPGDKAR